MPVFFGLAGLSSDMTILRDPKLLLVTAALVLIASIGKFGGAFAGGMIGGLSRRESFALGSAMNARGSTEVIVATIGLSMGVLSQNMFTMIVAMAVLTTLAMPPMLRAALGNIPLSRREKLRLDREEFEAKGFVFNLERLLVAVDESNNGKFTSRIAGLLAGAQGIPTTVLHIGRHSRNQEKKREREESAEAAVKSGAERTASTEKRNGDEKPEKVEVLTRTKRKKADEAIAEEARKGFDLLMVGMDKAVRSDGTFHAEVERAAAGFEGPLAVVSARSFHLEEPLHSSFRILVPVAGTSVSRKGMEVAVALARANDIPLTALYISNLNDNNRRRASTTRVREEAVLKEAIAIGERYDTEVTTLMRTNVSPAASILREAREGHFNLIVMGASRRPGDELFFGEVIQEVLERSKASILLIAS
jgi:nucleotide-binding universal stress UspA family protein